MEFRVWTELIQQSRGLLHIFLPLLDRGLDAVVHRLTDGEYIPIQVKSRGRLHVGAVEVTIPAYSLVDDRAVIIAGLFNDDGLGPTVLVVDEGTFKRLAARRMSNGFEVYSASFGMHPTDRTHWEPYLVPSSELAARILGAPPPPAGAEALAAGERLEPQDRHNQWLGFLGEAEVVRRLADNSRLDLFRPFPDMEMVEVLARDNVTGRFAGLQVKTAVPSQYGEAHIHVQETTFVPAPTTWVVGLAWIAETGRFADECLLVPTEHLREIAVDTGGRLVLDFKPESPARTPLDPYRHQLSELGALVGQITAEAHA
ncbi:MAG: hypothetical protein ACREOM_14200 [Candidatus Dormibacteraceae bacterium]